MFKSGFIILALSLWTGTALANLNTTNYNTTTYNATNYNNTNYNATTYNTTNTTNSTNSPLPGGNQTSSVLPIASLPVYNTNSTSNSTSYNSTSYNSTTAVNGSSVPAPNPSSLPSGRIWANQSPKLDPADVATSNTNPAGVNFGAALQAVVQCNELWFRNNRMSINDTSVSFKVSPPLSANSTTNSTSNANTTVTGGDQAVVLTTVTTQNYSQKAIWPEAYATAFKQAGWPVQTDGQLQAMGIDSALAGLTGLIPTKIYQSSSTTVTAGTFWNTTLAPMVDYRKPMVLETKPGFNREGFKSNYGYSVIAFNAKYLWLNDPCAEVDESVQLISDIFPYINNVYSLTTNLIVS